MGEDARATGSLRCSQAKIADNILRPMESAAASPASACSNCGKPIPPLERGRSYEGKPVCAACLAILSPLGTADRPLVTERTAKRIKIHMVVACLIVLAGLLTIGLHLSSHFARFDFSWTTLSIGLFFVLFGGIYLTLARLAAWWNHG